MSMKPRLNDPNKRIDPKLCTEPNPAQAPETYTRLEPFTVTERRNTDNTAIPGVVTGPRRHAG
jgi:hypothetical protein